MTLKPGESRQEEENHSPNSPETNDDDHGEDENRNNGNGNQPRETIKFYIGQQLDVLDSVNYWTEAEVVKFDEEHNKIFVSYLYWSSKWDEWVDISPDKVAPLHTHTYNPPNPLKLRQRIEVYGLSEWREAFVIDETATQVKVHYRNVSYQYDEWIDRGSDRIRKFGPYRSNKMKKWNIPTVPNSNSTATMTTESNQHTRQITQLSDRYNNYILGLEAFKLTVYTVSGDGNCLFRSVSHQIYGDDSFHLLVREKCIDYMEVNSAFFSQFVVGGMETFHLYLHAKRTNGCWGDDPEIQAMCEIYDRSAQIWAFDSTNGARCLRTFHEVTSRPNTGQARSRPSSSASSSSTSATPWWKMSATSSSSSNSAAQKQPIRLSYYGGGHYDSIISTMNNSPQVFARSPGVIEDRAIARARERVQLALSGQQQLEEVKQSTDLAATERAELELALEVSRNHLTQWEDDLDACLLISAREMSRGDIYENNEFKETELSPQVIETQHQLMQSAVELSEREYLEKAIEESIKSVTGNGIENENENDVDLDATEAALLDSAYEASLAITQSLQEETIPTRSIQPHTATNAMDSETKLALELSQLNEEEILQRVLKESLTQQSNLSYFSRAPPTSSLTASLREEEEIQEAIRMSMMNQFEPTFTATTTTTNTTTNANTNTNTYTAPNTTMPVTTTTNNSNYQENDSSSQLYHNVDLSDDPELELAIQESFRDLRR